MGVFILQFQLSDDDDDDDDEDLHDDGIEDKKVVDKKIEKTKENKSTPMPIIFPKPNPLPENQSDTEKSIHECQTTLNVMEEELRNIEEVIILFESNFFFQF